MVEAMGTSLHRGHLGRISRANPWSSQAASGRSQCMSEDANDFLWAGDKAILIPLHIFQPLKISCP